MHWSQYLHLDMFRIISNNKCSQLFRKVRVSNSNFHPLPKNLEKCNLIENWLKCKRIHTTFTSWCILSKDCSLKYPSPKAGWSGSVLTISRHSVMCWNTTCACNHTAKIYKSKMDAYLKYDNIYTNNNTNTNYLIISFTIMGISKNQ